MNKTTLINLANSLSHSKGDADTLDNAYYRVLDILARQTSPLVSAQTINLTDGTGEYTIGCSGSPRILALFVKPDNSSNYLLTREVGLRELEFYNSAWRTEQSTEGDPIAYTIVDVVGSASSTWTKVRLFPTPDTSVTDGIAYFCANRDEASDIQDFLALPIVFSILAIEFELPSDHQDAEFSKLCREIVQFLRAFVVM